MGRNLSPRYGQVILFTASPVLTAVTSPQHGHANSRQENITYHPPVGLIPNSLLTPPAPVRTGGRTLTLSRVGRLPPFLGYGATLRACVELRYYKRFMLHFILFFFNNFFHTPQSAPRTPCFPPNPSVASKCGHETKKTCFNRVPDMTCFATKQLKFDSL